MGNQCADVGAFRGPFSKYSIADLGQFSFGLVASLALLAVWFVLAISKRISHTIAPWWGFGPTIVLCMVSFICDIIGTVLQECFIADEATYWGLRIPDYLFYSGIVWLIWLGLFMLPLTLAILERAQITNKIFTFVQIGLFVLTIVFWIPYLSLIQTLIWKNNVADESIVNSSLFAGYKGVIGTYSMIQFLSVVWTCALLGWSLLKIRRHGSSNTALTVCVIITASFFFANTILFVITSLGEEIHEHYWSWASQVAIAVLGIFFQFGCAFFILFTAATKPLAPERPKRAARYWQQPAPNAYGGQALVNGYGAQPAPNGYGAPVAQAYYHVAEQKPELYANTSPQHASVPPQSVSPVHNANAPQQYPPIPQEGQWQPSPVEMAVAHPELAGDARHHPASEMH